MPQVCIERVWAARDRSGRPLPSAGDRMLASDWSRAPILASDWLPHLTSAPESTGGL